MLGYNINYEFYNIQSELVPTHWFIKYVYYQPYFFNVPFWEIIHYELGEVYAYLLFTCIWL